MYDMYVCLFHYFILFFFFKQKTAYEMRISDWSSDVCSSDLAYTVWASNQQPVWHWQGWAHGPDRWWTLATLIDAYYGFVTFFVWVCFKERGWLARELGRASCRERVCQDV